MLCDQREMRIHFRTGSVETTAALDPSVFGTYKASRNISLFDSLKTRVKTFFVADMEDCRAIEPLFYFQQDINIFQFNRRVGNRTAVLWRLPHYFEPSSQMGAVDGTAINDDVSFTDKLPKIYWRGDLSGSRWMTPYAADSVYEAKDLEDLRRISQYFSRPKAVYYSLANPDFTDFRFAGEDCKGIAGIEQAGLMTDKVAPTEFLKCRYVLCPNGNDVPTNLYWVIKSNSVAFREDCDFECVPDFFLKPWVHYVPVSKGLGDLKEKFSYCEANLDVCERIIEQANMAYLQLIDEHAWEEAENIVLDKLGMM